MKPLLFCCCLLFAGLASGQKDTVKHTLPHKLSKPQEKWLKKNYRMIASLSGDSARKVVNKNLTGVSEGSLELIISQATRLLQGDREAEINRLRLQLTSLRDEKQALTNRIAEKERELAAATKQSTRANLTQQINGLRTRLTEVESQILQTESRIRELNQESG